MINNNFVIDIHTHVWPENLAQKAGEFLENYYKFKWESLGTKEKLLNDMSKSGVDVSVAFSVATAVKQVEKINDFLAELQNEHIITFGAMHPDFSNFKDEIRRIKKQGHKGIKFHPTFQQFNIDDIKAKRIYEEIGDELPILIHLGDETYDFSTPRRMANVLDEQPYLRVIGAHLGGYKEWDEAEKHLIGRDLFLDTSSTISHVPQGYAEKLIKNHGAEKILFGSDFPSVRQTTELAKIEKLNIPAQDKKLILGENARKLLNLVSPAKTPNPTLL